MINIITNKLKNKYYTYVPGEFFPIYEGTELSNGREFHIYKVRRALWRIKRRWAIVRYNYALAKYQRQHAR